MDMSPTMGDVVGWLGRRGGGRAGGRGAPARRRADLFSVGMELLAERLDGRRLASWSRLGLGRSSVLGGVAPRRVGRLDSSARAETPRPPVRAERKVGRAGGDRACRASLAGQTLALWRA